MRKLPNEKPDDDAAMLALLNRHVQVAGYHGLTAPNGVEALHSLRSGDVRIVVGDWFVSEMDGIKLSRSIRADQGSASIYILILADNTEKGLAAEAFDAGADGFLRKPLRLVANSRL